MATYKNKDQNSKSDFNPNSMKTLNDLFGDALHIDVIKSVALNCDWDLDKACNILAELSSSVTSDRVIPNPRRKYPVSDINSVSYTGDDDADVIIEENEENTLNSQNLPYTKIITKKRANSPKVFPAQNKAVPVGKLPKRNQAQAVPPPRKNKRELEYDRVHTLICNGVKVLVLLRGLPGSGKSHMARTLVTSTIIEDYRRFVFSTDNYFERNGMYNFNLLQLHEAHEWNQKRVFDTMKLGMSPIVVDNTNTQIWEMRPYAAFAMHFGYQVEILEPCTVWIFNVPELAKRNSHNVPKQKIAEMADRYEKNITTDLLLKTYGLRYQPGRSPPQHRLYPPTHRNIQRPPPLMSIPTELLRSHILNVPNFLPVIKKNTKNKNNDFVMVPENGAKKKTQRKRNKKAQGSDTASVTSNTESTHSTIEQLSGSDSDTDVSSNLQKSDSFHSIDARDIFDKGQDLLSTDVPDNMEYVVVMPDKSFLNQKDHILVQTDTKSLDDLINFNDNEQIDNMQSIFNHNLITLTENLQCNLDNDLDKNPEAVNDDISNMRNELSALSLEPQKEDVVVKQQVKLDGSTFPKLDIGTFSEVWETLNKPKVIPMQHNVLKYSSELVDLMTLKDCSTNTLSSDFNLLRWECGKHVKVLYGVIRNIDDVSFSKPLKPPPKVLMLDKGTMTGIENFLDNPEPKSCSKKTEHFSTLLNLFPQVSEDNLQYVFDQCKGDVNWAVDLLLESNKEDCTAEVQPRNIVNVTKQCISLHEHDKECCCTSDYEIQPYIPTTGDIVKIDVEPESLLKIDAAKMKQMKPKNRSADDPLKKHLEEQFRINDEHYSHHILNLRKKRHGEMISVPSSSKDNQENPIPSTSEASVGSKEAEDSESEISSEDEMIELNFGLTFIDQLEKKFGNVDLEYPQGFQPVMQLPASLARQLHAFWLESVFTQMEAQSFVLDEIEKQDQELARKLQQSEENLPSGIPEVPDLHEIMDMEIALAVYRADQEQWKKETPDDIASRMKRQKLYEAFPNIDRTVLVEILQAHGNSFEQTVEGLMCSIGKCETQMLVDVHGKIRTKTGNEELTKQKELMEKAKKEYIQVKQLNNRPSNNAHTAIDEEDDEFFYPKKQSASFYRDQAAHHLEMRQQLFQKANQAFQKGLTQVASYYSDVAKLHMQKFEHANSRAASAFLSEHTLNHQNSKTLDLHYLYVKEAEQAMALFIDSQISQLQASKKSQDALFIITGRGNHSVGGISHIKPAIKRRLKERKLGFSEMNPGLLKVLITNHSVMTNDLKNT